MPLLWIKIHRWNRQKMQHETEWISERCQKCTTGIHQVKMKVIWIIFQQKCSEERAKVVDRENNQRLRQVKEVRISHPRHEPGPGGREQTIWALLTGLCLLLITSLMISSPSPLTSQRQSHSLMMVPDENRNCCSKWKFFSEYNKRILWIV